METLKDILWPIVMVGGLGAFIDFLIGKTGQERAKDLLFRWWVRFDDVRWNNFGREEGLFAGNLIGRWFGRRIWGLQRITTAISILSLFFLLGSIRLKFLLSANPNLPYLWCLFCAEQIFLTYVIIAVVGFCMSVSFTKFITFRSAHLCGVSQTKNLVMFITMLIVNYIILVNWFPATQVTKLILSVVINGIIFNHYITNIGLFLQLGWSTISHVQFNLYPDNVIILFTDFYRGGLQIDDFAFRAASYLPSLFRFFLSLVFVGSFLLRPLVMRPVSLVWARIVESDKPVFTLVFGGAAAFGTAISEAAKHL